MTNTGHMSMILCRARESTNIAPVALGYGLFFFLNKNTDHQQKYHGSILHWYFEEINSNVAHLKTFPDSTITKKIYTKYVIANKMYKKITKILVDVNWHKFVQAI